MRTDASDAPLDPEVFPLVPMRNLVLFPDVLMPVSVGRLRSVAAIDYALRSNSMLVLVLQRDARDDAPQQEGLHAVGTLARIVRDLGTQEGLRHLVCQGVGRVRIEQLEQERSLAFMAARVSALTPAESLTTQVEALGLQVRERAAEVLSLLPGVPAEIVHTLQSTRGPAELADLTASLIDVDLAQKQQLLETVEVDARLQKVLQMLTHRIEVLKLSQEIGELTKANLSDRERKYLLREQLRTIQKELGEAGDDQAEVTEIDAAIAQADMPVEVEAHARKELERLERIGTGSPEYGMLHTYLDWMTGLPWRLQDEAVIDLDAAARVLEADHFGLKSVKQRIIEFLAVQKLNPHGRAPILCFVGPPGVGKTSLGQSIARALERPFVRVSLGGVHDEAEMRGHRRTYVGAMPGRIVQALRKAGSRQCVMMLDEVDKLGAGVQGDPSAALLEVLDPEQNASFRDNYLGVPVDLSRVVFIATANVIDAVSPPVRDRMEVIELPGYTQEEKLQIATGHLLARQFEANGVKAGQCEISGEALRDIVAHYTREAGVRQLEREIGRVMRHVALRVARGASGVTRIDTDDLQTVLGPPKFETETAMRVSLPGVATGLAWTPVGGDILFVEASRIAGNGRLILTGQLGEVMKESAQAALTLVKSHAAALGIANALFEGIDVHLHVPAGAIPKDGPSAGVTMFVALASLFAGRVVHRDVAMTGEISLRGLVLPVGGIKDKVLAAQRAGLRCVLLPARNRKDLADVPDSVRAALTFVWLETVDDAIAAALGAHGDSRDEAAFRLL